MTGFANRRVTAVLGPTNTGKTHLAIDRMLGHASGMIGFPLRLLARENYDRVVRLKGARQVALVTGEEKIVPPGARYFLCTVESMPLDRQVAFLAVDEIQLCADPERGHVFTERLLHARGSEETMFLGADTIRPVLRRLVPDAAYISRPRFSTLTYAGARKLTRLPPRSALVAFSAAEVYAMAELIRRQRGGTAVVLGALSPRTRNAQVGLFEAGDVDYLVATDAIGMGLNLSLDHVAFARLGKFDGRAPRRLTAPEIGQIAGRAGRHMSDGTFGTTPEAGAIAPEIVEAVEGHQFDPLDFVYWRSHELDFASPQSLLASLERNPPVPKLVRTRGGDDHLALAVLARDPEVAALATRPAAVGLLWEVCQVPDFRKVMSDSHIGLLRRIYRHLMTGEGHLPADWVARSLAGFDRVDGDIDALTARIAHVRTWTYISHRADWLRDAAHWQGAARAIEDRLSDSLHERLTQRFVDRRASLLVQALREGGDLIGAVRSNGELLVEGEHVGRLDGFRFRLDGSIEGVHSRAVQSAARRALRREIPARVKRLEQDDDGSFALRDQALTWRGAEVARLLPGDGVLKPRVEPLASDLLDGRARERLRARLAAWLERHLRSQLRPLFTAGAAELSGPARGLVYQLVQALGLLPRRALAAQIAGLTKADRRTLDRLGVRLGAASVFFRPLQAPGGAALRGRLWALQSGLEPPVQPPADGGPLLLPGELLAGWSSEAVAGYCQALGYCWLERADGRRGRAGRRSVQRALRGEALERIAHEARKLARGTPFAPDERLLRLAGSDPAVLHAALTSLGYRREDGAEGPRYAMRRRRPGKRPAGGTQQGAACGPGPGHPAGHPAGHPKAQQRSRRSARRRTAEAASPFAKLRDLVPRGQR